MMIGLVLGGIATSLLFSAFELGLVAEHFKVGKGWHVLWRCLMRSLPTFAISPQFCLSMVDQVAKPLTRPVRVLVLDATLRNVRAGVDGYDHPAELISFPNTLLKKKVCKLIF